MQVVPFPLKCEPYVDPQTGLTLGKVSDGASFRVESSMLEAF